MDNIYKAKSPILFLIFNRLDVTTKVFERIKMAQPSKLYIAADGARKEKKDEIKLCQQTRDIVTKISWDCEVKFLFRDENLGCKYAVSSAIDWFFENEEEGIILEDDCLPSIDFFRFSDEMLEKYRTDTRIRFVAGSNFQNGIKRSEASYYFSNLSHVWGWASWRRAWKDYDVELTKYKSNNNFQSFLTIFNNEILAIEWNEIIVKLFDNQINTWDYQWAITNMFNNGLSIMPNVNLIANIGFGEDATHTFEKNGFENIKYGILDKELIHPLIFLPSKEADLYTLSREHNLLRKTKKHNKKKFVNKLKFWKPNKK